MERLRDFLAIETVNTLNEALCWNHQRICPDIVNSKEFQSNCGQTNATAEALRKAYIQLGSVPYNTTGSLCRDSKVRTHVSIQQKTVSESLELQLSSFAFKPGEDTARRITLSNLCLHQSAKGPVLLFTVVVLMLC